MRLFNFYSKECVYCQKVTDELKFTADIISIDVDVTPLTAAKYHINYVPTLIVVDYMGNELYRSHVVDKRLKEICKTIQNG
jgi:thioredoxin-related protein